MTNQNDLYIFDINDEKALEACLMELSDLFWDLFERQRLAAVHPEMGTPTRLSTAKLVAHDHIERKRPAY
jgi:hypothetical protein